MRRSKGYLFIHSELSISEESATVTHVLARTQRQAEEWESLIVETERVSEVHWPGEAGDGIIGAGAALWLIRRAYLALSGWFQVGNKDKIREAVCY